MYGVGEEGLHCGDSSDDELILDDEFFNSMDSSILVEESDDAEPELD